MRFKILTLALLLSSCSLKLNEDPVKPQSLMVTSAQQGCLANSGKTISKFFDGKISENELDSFWNCLTHSFQMFADNTRGSELDYYAPEELAGFMSKYFLDGKPVPAPLLKQAMNLKKGVMGGTADRITRIELKNTVRLIQVFHVQSMKIRPYLPLGYESILKRNLTDEELETATSAFQNSMVEIGKGLEGSIGTYSLDDFHLLMKELKSYLYPNATEKTWIDSTLNMAAVIGPAKSIFIAPPATQISQTDWPQFFYLVPRYFTLYLKVIYYYQTPRDYQYGAGLNILDKVFNEGMDLVSRALENHPNGKVDKEEITAFINSLDKVDLLPDDVARIKKIAQLITTKVFPDPDSREMQISKANLKSFRDAVTYYTEGLHGLESIFRRELGENNYLLKSTKREDLLAYSVADFLKGTVFQSEISKNAVENVRSSVRDIKVNFPNNSNIVFVPYKKDLNQYSYFHLAKIHLFRTINQVLLRSYGGNGSISQKQTAALISDLDPIFDLFKFKSEDLVKSLPARFFEASLFLPASDGSQSMKMNEAVEFESLLISTFDRSAKIHQFIAAKCPKKKDANGDPLIEPDCFRRQFSLQIKRYWDFVPGLATYVESLSSANQIALFEQMDSFLRKGRTNSFYTKGDTKSFVLMPYYIELLFDRFDANNDGVLDEQEAKTAYPVFEPFISVKADEKGQTGEDAHYKIFTFILSHHYIPQSIWESAVYLAWSKDGKFTANRGDIVTIFATLLSL